MTAESFVFAAVLWSARLAAWMLTYAIHSTCILGLTLLALRTVWRSAPAVRRDLALKAALIAGMLTATARTAAMLPSVIDPIDASRLLEVRRWNGLPVIPLAPDSIGPSSQIFAASLPDAANALRLLPLVAVLIWGAFACLVVVRVLVAASMARAALGSRKDVRLPRLRTVFDQLLQKLRVKRTVRLTTTATAVSPVALGNSEVCLPERVLSELTAEEQRGVLAHEAAHLARRDPWWLLVATAIESIFFFQPLNRRARVRLQEEAEYIADDIAARLIGSGAALARCLAKVAEWLALTTQRQRVFAPALAEPRATMFARVQRLLRNEGDATSVRAGPALVLMSIVPLSVAIVGPAITMGSVRSWGVPAFHWEGNVERGQRVEIVGVAGSIRAEPWNGTTVVVNATRHGRYTGPDIRIQLLRHERGVTICVVYPRPPGRRESDCKAGISNKRSTFQSNGVEVEFLVRVPSGVGFAAATSTGNVTTGDLDAPISAQTATGRIIATTTSYAQASSLSGNVTVRMGSTDWSDTVRIASLSGHVAVSLPRQTNAIVTARTRVGTIDSDYPALSPPHQRWWERMALHGSLGATVVGTLGRGERVLLLTTEAGDVSITKT
jgi:beta-lactamase regulating signal transducer with metallopeptidase domain